MDKDLALIGWILVVLVLASLFGALAMATRRAAIRRPGGAVQCSLRNEGDERWRRGVAAYRTDQLCWFRSYGVGLRPDAAFDRHALQLVTRPDSCPPGVDHAAGPRVGLAAFSPASQAAVSAAEPAPWPAPGLDRSLSGRETVVVRFETGADGEPVSLAMSRDALTGLLAWLEAGPQRWLGGLC